MSRARPNGPMWPHRKTNFPAVPGAEYLVVLAVSLGRKQARREDFMSKARQSGLPSQRAFYVARARDWHRLCMGELRLMRMEERFFLVRAS